VTESVYQIRNGKPEMQESFLVFIDILGYQSLVRSAKSRTDQQHLLSRLHKALSRHVPVLSHQDDGDNSPWYASRVFTDNIVLARPLFHFTGGEGESELGHMMLDAALYQLNLALEGFFVRGGIAVGPAYVDDHVVFGPALIEAHDLERERAVFPRIILSAGARGYIGRHVNYYAGGAQSAPQNDELLVDSDGEWFINYVDSARGTKDPEYLYEHEDVLRFHRDRVVESIVGYRENRHVLEKYLWVGRYHNYVSHYLFPDNVELLIPDELFPGGFRRLAEVIHSEKVGLDLKAT
jgi:hypothetical protein